VLDSVVRLVIQFLKENNLHASAITLQVPDEHNQLDSTMPLIDRLID